MDKKYHRRTVGIESDNYEGIQQLRSKYLLRNEDVSFIEMINRVLRKGLKEELKR